jgi:predicted  nucleic acid-binding Zn-ribbon protein
MTQFNKIDFTSKEIVQIIGGIVFIGSMWLDLRTEITTAKKEREFLQYQLTEHDKRINELRSSLTYRSATKPEEPKLKSYTQ